MAPGQGDDVLAVMLATAAIATAVTIIILNAEAQEAAGPPTSGRDRSRCGGCIEEVPRRCC
jgi:hypothetical protein